MSIEKGPSNGGSFEEQREEMVNGFLDKLDPKKEEHLAAAKDLLERVTSITRIKKETEEKLDAIVKKIEELQQKKSSLRESAEDMVSIEAEINSLEEEKMAVYKQMVAKFSEFYSGNMGDLFKKS